MVCRCSDDGGTDNDDVDRRLRVDSEVYDFATYPAEGNGTEERTSAVVQTRMKKKGRKATGRP